MAEWLCSGLQIRQARFDSGLRLQKNGYALSTQIYDNYSGTQLTAPFPHLLNRVFRRQDFFSLRLWLFFILCTASGQCRDRPVLGR